MNPTLAEITMATLPSNDPKIVSKEISVAKEYNNLGLKSSRSIHLQVLSDAVNTTHCNDYIMCSTLTRAARDNSQGRVMTKYQ